MALKSYMGIRSARLAKTKFVYFSVGFSFLLYIIWIPISVYQFLYHSYPNNWKYFKYVDVDIYTEIAWTFSLAIAQNEFTQRELEKLDSFKKLYFFGEHVDKSERLSRNLMENKKSRDEWKISIYKEWGRKRIHMNVAKYHRLVNVIYTWRK